jgi:hypothetical protein
MPKSLDDLAAELVGGGSAPVASSALEPSPAVPISRGRKSLDELAADVVGDQSSQRRMVLESAARTNPDEAAEAAKLAEKTGLPADVVARNLMDVRVQQAVMDADRKLPMAPDLERRMRESPLFAKQAMDDLDKLTAAHGELKAWKGPRATIGNIARDLAGVLPGAARTARETARLIAGDMLDAFGILTRTPQEQQEDIRRAAQAAAQADHNRPEFEGATAQGIYSGVTSTLQQLPGLALSIATANPFPALAAAGGSAALDAYQRYRSRGGTPGEAALGGALEGVVEIATEFLPMQFFVNKLAKKGVGEFVTGLMAREIPGEQVATLLQDAVDTAIANPDKTWAEYLAERPGAAYQTLVATVTQSVLMGGGAHVVNRIVRGTEAIQQAQDDDAKLRRLFEVATDSKLRQRNPQEFAKTLQEFAEASPDAPETVFIDARALDEAFAQAGLNDAQVAELLPSVAPQIAQALAADTVVSIPLGELVANTAGSPLADTLLQQVRITPESLTPLEAQEAQEQAQEYLMREADSVIAQAQDAAAIRDEQTQVQQEVMAQLQSAGRFRPEVMQSYAMLTSAFYTTMAGRMGMTPLQLWQQRQLRVAATDPTQDERTTLEQPDGALNGPDGNPAAIQAAAAPEAGGLRQPGGMGGSDGLLASARWPHQSNGSAGVTLEGLPAVVKVNGQQVRFSGYKPAQDAAASYAESIGLPYNPPRAYAKVNPDRARRIAAEFDSMKHDPHNPEVKAAYDALVQETIGQYKAALAAGLKVEFIDYAKTGDPYGNPRNAILDVVENNHMWVFSTRDGFGTDATFDPSDNPLLAETEFEISGQKALVNDLFRVVHDYFGHVKEGVGFRADGEENAWRAHSAMFSPLARRALTTETRGQNSWVNYGPHGENNRTASPEETHFADQKIGLLPQWVSEEGVNDDEAFAQLMSTRVPTATKATEKPLEEMLVVGLESTKADPKFFAKNIALIEQYDSFPNVPDGASDDEKAEAFIEHVKANLLWLHDQVPEETRQRSKLWYDGARNIVDRWVSSYGITDAQAAGMLAVLSPQKDWFQNVSLSERVLDIMSTKQDFRWDDAMSATAASILPLEKFGTDIEVVTGKTLGELADDNYLQAMWIRVYDQTHNNRAYRIVSPEGRFEQWSTTAKGEHGKAAWGSFTEIGKAVAVFKDGSANSISLALGGMHKVRNFYNNIIAPGSELGEVTIDTHAVAAGLLQPLSGASAEVLHNFGSGGAPKSSITGVKGTYGIYAEAYRRAAKDRGILAREMQSITWEAVRGLFTPRFKAQESNVQFIASLWRQFKAGKATLDETRNLIAQESGGIIPPEWDRPGGGSPAESWTSSYQGELDTGVRPGGTSGSGARSDAGRGTVPGVLWQLVRPDGAGSLPGGGLAEEEIRGQVGKTYGVARDGAHPPLTAYHFSRQPRTTLTSGAYGTGLQGAEMARLEGADPRLKQRIYFYIDRGTGINPEAGVGGYAHSVTLNNVYDSDADPLRLLRDAGGANNFELAVIKAGFDGYMTRDAGPSGNVVLLGAHAVGVDQMGPQTRFSGQVVPRAQERVLSIGEQIVGNKELPQGQLKGARWLEILTKRMPDVVAHYGANNPAFQSGDFMYRDGLVKALEAGLGELQQRARGTYSPNQTLITLTTDADLSTFIHESGHFFLDMLTDLASAPGAPAAVMEDVNTILRWFGLKDDEQSGSMLQQWRAMSLEGQRQFHERWAESFEQYALEGKAPSTELRPVFARFRAWLLSIYKGLRQFVAGRNYLRLSDEVRAVMDRMLASDEQIRQAEALARYEAVFRDPGESGMSPEEWAKYQADHAAATEDAIATLTSRTLKDLQWAQNARSRELKRLQKEADDKRKDMRKEVTEQLRMKPVYAVQRFLKTGKVPENYFDGANRDQRRALTDVGLGKVKLSTKALQEMYGDSPAAPWRYLSTSMLSASEDAVHPNVIAELFGFDDGDAMVRAILEALPEDQAIEQATDQGMLEAYGDITTPQAMEAAANEAIHNEARARFLASEIAALRKGMGGTVKVGKANVNVMVQAAKEFAEKITARRRILDLKPHAHTAAESRAGMRAQEAMAKGKTEEVLAAKRDQLLNHYAAKYAAKAQENIEKQLAYLRKFDKDSVRKNLPPEYLEQIDAILERFDLRKGTSARDIQRSQSLMAWVAQQQAMGLDPNIPQEVLDEAQRRSYKEMTVEEFTGMVDGIKNIEHLGRLKSKLLKAKDQREFQAIVDEIAAHIKDRAKTVREPDLNARTSKLDRIKDMGRQFLAEHRKISSIVRQLDGFEDAGPMWRAFVRSMNESADAEATMRADATAKLSKLFERFTNRKHLVGKSWSMQEKKMGLTLETRLSIALNWGNEANRQRVMDGDRLSPAQVQAILGTLTRDQLQFVQDTWDFIDGYWEQIKAKEERVSGVAPEKVEPAPFNVRLSDGTEVAMKGGYYPIKYDPDKSRRAQADSAAEVTDNMLKGHYTRASTSRGHTKARVEHVERPVRHDLGVVFQHVSQVIHDLAWHEWLIDANRLLSAPEIDQAIRDTMGPVYVRELNESLTDIAMGDIPAQSGFEQAMARLRRGVSAVGMGYNLMTSLMQPLGLLQSMARIGPKWVGKGLSKWIGDAVHMENTVARINDKSDFMKHRAATMNREIAEVRGRMEKGKLAAVEDSYYWLIQKAQMIADVPTWLGAYEKAMAEFDGDENIAVDLADQAVRDSQGSGEAAAMARIQRKDAVWKLFTTFYSFFNTTYNIAAEKVNGTDFHKPREVGRLAVDMLLLMVLPSVLATLMRQAIIGGDDDDEDELAKKLVQDQLSYLMGTMVGLREASTLVSDFDYTGPAGVRFFSELHKLGKQAGQGEIDGPLMKALNNTAGILFHYPAGQINRMVEGYNAWSEGEAGPQSVIVGPPR